MPLRDAVPPQQAAIVLTHVLDRAPRELETAELTVAGGDTVRILCLSEVEDWLRGLVARANAGERL